MTDLTFQVYADRDITGTVYFVGASEWQTCTSQTVACYYTDSIAKAKEAARRAAANPAGADAVKRPYDTWGRFEMACERGQFGPKW